MNATTLPLAALTNRQPYAELILLGEKVIENRTWPTNYRGWLAIHAGKSRSWLEDGDEVLYPRMTFGAVVAIATLSDCVRVERLPAHLVGNEHAHGPWCWLLSEVRRITPVPYRGAQGLWSLPADVVGMGGDRS